VGMVTDKSGALVQRAKVTVRNQETNSLRTVETDQHGEYTVPLLFPGYYEVAVEMSGFRRSIQKDVKLDVDQTLRVDFGLQLGNLAEVVTVSESVPLIQTDTSALGQVVDQGKVSELPLNQRNFLTFALLVPGAQTPAEGSQNSSQGGAISVNGAREQSNNFLLDGVDNNDPYINQYSVLPSIDAIQEFKVQSSGYSAEFGRTGGAQINIVLKSGANKAHASAFEFVRNRRLDAKNYFDMPDCTPTSVPGTCAEIPRFDRNQFGGTLGGPIRRDRTFFFGSYEGLRLRQAITQEATVPSRFQRVAVVADLPPGYRNPAGDAIFNLIPLANVGKDLVNSNTFVAAPVLRSTADQALVKLDHQIGPKSNISGHYSLFREDRFNPYDPLNNFTLLPGYGSFTQNRSQHAAFTWTQGISPRWLNEFRFGFNRLRARMLQEHSGTNKSKELGFPTVLDNPVDYGYPNVQLLGFDGIGEPVNYPQERRDNTFHFADNAVWQPISRHSITFGADLRRVQLNAYLNFLARGEWFFLGGLSNNPMAALTQLLVGIPDFAIGVKGTTDHGLRSTGLSFYFQDDIRVITRFTLNVGLRYEYNSPPTEIQDRFTVPDLSPKSLTCSPKPDCQFIRAGTQGVTRATYQKDRNNLAPRIGFAWRPLGTGRFVVRGAYGIFYDVGILNPNIFPRMNPPFFEVTFHPNSGRDVIQNILSQPGFAYVQPNMISPSFQDGYMQHRLLGMQYELLPNWVLDLGYAGSKGTHLLGTRDLNQSAPGSPTAPFPQFASIFLIESRANSSYDALQLRTERRFSRGLSFLGAYTWSRSIDDSSAVFGSGVTSGIPQDSQNIRAERALSDFHVKHRFVVSYLHDLPFGQGRRWLNRPGWASRLLDGWSLTGIVSFQTGHPFTVIRATSSSSTAITAFGTPDRPDLIANPFTPGPVRANSDPGCQRTRSQGGRAADKVQEPESWFNPCAFSDPGPARFGTAGRNAVIGPGYGSIDLSVLKDIKLVREDRRLQFRAEIFNMLNRPNFDSPNRTFDSPLFAALLSSNGQGTKPPRQIQLVLKLIF